MGNNCPRIEDLILRMIAILLSIFRMISLVVQSPRNDCSLRKKFHESIFEIFSNAVLHSQTKFGIYSCGQFYPNRNKLDFSVADLGVGMPKR